MPLHNKIFVHKLNDPVPSVYFISIASIQYFFAFLETNKPFILDLFEMFINISLQGNCKDKSEALKHLKAIFIICYRTNCI